MLSDNEIKKLMTAPSIKAEIAATNRAKWPGPNNMLLLAKAVKDKLPFVMFQPGSDKAQRFKIRYTQHFGGTVFIKPDSNAFIPCGYFSLRKLNEVLMNVEGADE